MAHERRRDLAKFEGSLVRAPMMFQPCFLAVEKKERMTAKSIAPSNDRNLREINGKITNETRFYITSLVTLANAVGPMIRAHWAIENSLHWVMDMVFRDDECRVRTDNAPANFATCRHIAYNLTRKAPGKDSIRLRRKTAGWDDEYLASLVAA
jgi:predicted transposase YbfD/YdcC